jgi:uncharacterized membrane protein (UPF0127 family)
VATWEQRLDGLPVSSREGLRVYEARSFLARLRGLAGVDALPHGVGLYLPRTRSVHTFGMRFALDLLWLDADGAVVRVDRGVPPRRHRSCRRARSVIEIAGGGYTRQRLTTRNHS